MFDLNTAETGTNFGPIPVDTVARAVLTIKPGGAGEGGWLKQAASGALMIHCEWTVVEGKYAKRKVFDNMLVTGSEQAVAITKKNLRALVEGHFGIRPDDMSDDAQAKRRVTIEQLNGMTGCLLIGQETRQDGTIDNRTKAVLAPGDQKYLAPGQLPPEKPKAPAAAGASYGAQPGYGAQPPAYGAQPPAYGAAAGYQAPPPPAGNVPAWGG